MKGAIMSTRAVITVLALALLLSGIVEQADNDLNEALGIKHTPLLQLIVGIGTGLLIWKSYRASRLRCGLSSRLFTARISAVVPSHARLVAVASRKRLARGVGRL